MKYEINSREEREYLANYDINQFEQPSVAADIVTFAVMKDGEQNNIRKLAKRELKILLIKRAQFPIHLPLSTTITSKFLSINLVVN